MKMPKNHWYFASLFTSILGILACSGSDQSGHPPTGDKFFVQIGDRTFVSKSSVPVNVSFPSSDKGEVQLGFTVYENAAQKNDSVDGPGVVSMGVVGPFSALVSFKTLEAPIGGRTVDFDIQKNSIAALKIDGRLVTTGTVSVSLDQGRISGKAEGADLTFNGKMSLRCSTQATRIPGNKVNPPVPVEPNGLPVLFDDAKFASPECAAAKALLR